MFIATVITAPTFIDGTTQFFGYRESTNTLRFTTGLIAGIGLLILAKGIKFALGIKWSLIT